MKPLLVIGLGNPLMGDDGIGCHVAARLAGDPRLPESVEVISGGTDLLRFASQIEGRSRVFILDAIHDDAEPGAVSVFAADLPGLDERQEHAHHLSAVQAIGVLRILMPVRITLVGISISSAAIESGLSPALDTRVPAIVDRVLQELA
ncbi:MAG TPA: hydrogenase maturation protease [Steroidobacteraceae bacterium]|nr:hydrogenase maturation protease [Steroidobacteraceae bacterium]